MRQNCRYRRNILLSAEFNIVYFAIYAYLYIFTANYNEYGNTFKAYCLFNDLRLGENKHLEGIYYVNGQACYLSGSKIKDKDGKPELQILVSYCNAKEAIEMYRKRWQVETLFKGLKSSGFDIEGSHVRGRGRMSNLLSIIMIACVWCYLVEIYIYKNIKPIKVLKHGRRAVRLFKYWLDYISQCLMNHTDRYRINVFKFLSYTYFAGINFCKDFLLGCYAYC